MIRYVVLLAAAVLIISCSKDDKPLQQQQTDKRQNEEIENPADTNLSPEEKFSGAVMLDFLDDSEDDDLGSFLETEVYKMGASYNGAAVVEVTPSTWLVSLEKDGVLKNYLIQKYIDFKTSEYYFSMKETTLTITDIISRRRSNTSAGE